MKRWLGRWWAWLTTPRMIYGYRHPDGRWLQHTRVSTHTRIEHAHNLDVGDHVFIGHFNVVDASGGLTIGEGCQITNYVSILSHSSHRALRLMGRAYLGHPEPVGYVKAQTHIGAYTFIGPHTVVAPGARIGKGALILAHSYVSGEVADFAIVGGQPAKVLGDTRERDRDWLARHPAVRTYYDAWSREA